MHEVKMKLLFRIFLVLGPSCFWACESGKGQSEKCEEGGKLYNSRWCFSPGGSTPPLYTTYDYDLLQSIKQRANSCHLTNRVDSLNEREKDAIRRNADDFVSLDAYVPEGHVWSYAVGRCWNQHQSDTSNHFSETELRQKVVAFMDQRYRNDREEFEKRFPNCDLRIPINPFPNKVPYGVTGCSPDTTSAGGTRIPTGNVNVAVKVHFDAFYDATAFNNPDVRVPNRIRPENAIEYSSDMLLRRQIRHDILGAAPVVNQVIHVDSVLSTPWEHHDLPMTNFWSKNASTRIALETPLVVTALTQIVKGNGANPTKLFSRFMSKDSTDPTDTFTDRTKFDYRKGEDLFIAHHKVELEKNWTRSEIRYREMHFNFLYVERPSSFIHLFILTDASGRNSEEVFCNCVGAACFVDTAYVAGCKSSGERKFVPPAEDSVYWVFARNNDEYDGSHADPPNTGSAEIKRLYEEQVAHVGAYTLPNKGAINNSFYVFPFRSAWKKTLGGTSFEADAETFQKFAVAHEIGHYVCGFVHARDENHIMAGRFPGFKIRPILELPFLKDPTGSVSSFNLAQGIWSQPNIR